MERKHPKIAPQFVLSRSRSSRLYCHHPQYIKNPVFLIQNVPFFHQYTYYNSANENPYTPYIDEYTLLPTLTWISFHNFCKPLKVPMKNNPADIALRDTIIHHLTIALHVDQFTTIGLNQTLNRFIAPTANWFSIKCYDHAVTRSMEDYPYDDDPKIKLKLTEIFSYYQNLYSTLIALKKFDNIIDDSHIYPSAKIFHKISHFALAFNFLTPKERDIYCSQEIMLKTKLTNKYTYYEFMQKDFIHSSLSRNPHLPFIIINSKYTSPYFLSFSFCIKSNNLHGILRIYDPIRPHFMILFHRTNFNHKRYNLTQNTSLEFSATTGEIDIIRALDVFWPLLRSKNIISMLAKLLVMSDSIKTKFPIDLPLKATPGNFRL